MNLIYICVFFQESYINLLYLLIQSIFIKGCINKYTTDIMILTDYKFLNKIIPLLSIFDLPIKYGILNVNTIFEAGWARLNIFKYKDIHLYDKILYLDTDILINNDLNILFNLELDKNKLYALEEGKIEHPFWGGQFFDFSIITNTIISNYNRNTTAFTSGILLFFNTQPIIYLFHDIINHILSYNSDAPICLDQPFIVYNAVIQNKYDNQILNSYAENNPNINNNKIIYHFPGIVGNYRNKYDKMNTFWEIINRPLNINKIKIYQHSNDGFGHQLEGTIRLLSLSLNNKAEYQYNYNNQYSFEHFNFDKQTLINYFVFALNALNSLQPRCNISNDSDELNIVYESRDFNTILLQDKNYYENIYLYNGIGDGSRLPNNFESKKELEKSLPLLREVFINNIYLPKPSYNCNKDYINVCCHIRLGDAIGQRILDNNSLYNVIKCFQKKNNFCINIHSNGNIEHLAGNNTILHDMYTDVLQVFSDFVYSDILIINYSSLSIAAHLLANTNQIVICPDNAGVTFKDRILDKCITCSQFMQKIL